MAILFDDINKIYLATTQIFNDNQFGLIDTILSAAKVENLTQEMMIAYLEATREKKDKLKHRQSFFKRSSDELDRRGEKKSRKFERLA